MTKDHLRKLFTSSPKLRYIEHLNPDSESFAVYRSGSFIDVSPGPHIQNASQIRTFLGVRMDSRKPDLLDVAADGFVANRLAQRVCGMAFPNASRMKQRDAFKDRDSLSIGKEQKLF